MIKQVINVHNYWKVIVYYNIDYDFFNTIEKDLKETNASDKVIDDIYFNMSTYRAKGVTFSNIKLHKSIILLNNHKTKSDYISTIVHEAEHVKDGMLEAYDVANKGEAPAYTIGYLVSRMYKVFRYVI